MIILGCASFALMLLGDINDAFWKRKPLRLLFPLALALLCAATAASVSLKSANAVWCLIAAVFLMLLIYALFGSFPVKEAYVAQDTGRQVHDKGFYGMCRHPGVIFFAGLYFSLCFALSLPRLHAIVYTCLNLLLAAAEDTWIFPRVIDGYGAYKKRVPFIIPRASCLGEIFKRN